MSIPLTETRFKCIADYPRDNRPYNERRGPGDSTIYDLPPHYHKGQIITAIDPKAPFDKWKEQTKEFFKQYPGLFKQIDWWQHRTVEEMCSVKFVLILTDKHPKYKFGDQVRVKDYIVLTKPLRFAGFYLHDYDSDNIIYPDDCFPTDHHELIPRK